MEWFAAATRGVFEAGEGGGMGIHVEGWGGPRGEDMRSFGEV